MSSRIDEIVSAITRLKCELEQEMHGPREQWRYRVDAGRVRFQAGVRETHRRLKNSIPRFLRDSNPLHILIAPILYSLIIPVVIPGSLDQRVSVGLLPRVFVAFRSFAARGTS